MQLTRRTALLSAASAGALAGCGSLAPVSPLARAKAKSRRRGSTGRTLNWRRGIENQRRADLGDGTFLNPILAGDHPDPTILRDGDVWYMTFSSFEIYPGLVIWKSPDLVNWTPVDGGAEDEHRLGVGAGTREAIRAGALLSLHPRALSGRTLDLCDPRREDRGAVERAGRSQPAAPHRSGPCGGRGRQALSLPVGRRSHRLSDDGLSTIGDVTHVYDPWKYPDEWVVEGFAPEGPKIMRRGDWFYLITAVGGTAGPPTGHMVIAARSKSIHGPWEDAPNNPIVRTWSAREKWWSRGHATLVEGPRRSTGGWSITAMRTGSGRSAARRCSIRSAGRRMDGSRRRAAICRSRCASRRAYHRRAAWHGAVRRFLDRSRRADMGLPFAGAE